MLEDFKTMPLDYTLVREPKDVPIGLDSDFWDWKCQEMCSREIPKI